MASQLEEELDSFEGAWPHSLKKNSTVLKGHGLTA
jgi:hypothetical protein